MKFIYHVLIFVLGCSLGLWYGVHHPTEAANITAKETKIAAEAKVAVLNKLKSSGVKTAGAPDDKVTQLLSDSQKELDDAKQKLGEK